MGNFNTYRFLSILQKLSNDETNLSKLQGNSALPSLNCNTWRFCSNCVKAPILANTSAHHSTTWASLISEVRFKSLYSLFKTVLKLLTSSLFKSTSIIITFFASLFGKSNNGNNLTNAPNTSKW